MFIDKKEKKKRVIHVFNLKIEEGKNLKSGNFGFFNPIFYEKNYDYWPAGSAGNRMEMTKWYLLGIKFPIKARIKLYKESWEKLYSCSLTRNEYNKISKKFNNKIKKSIHVDCGLDFLNATKECNKLIKREDNLNSILKEE